MACLTLQHVAQALLETKHVTECSVCFELFTKETIAMTECGHCFCKTCLGGGLYSCPTCRASFRKNGSAKTEATPLAPSAFVEMPTRLTPMSLLPSSFDIEIIDETFFSRIYAHSLTAKRLCSIIQTYRGTQGMQHFVTEIWNECKTQRYFFTRPRVFIPNEANQALGIVNVRDIKELTQAFIQIPLLRSSAQDKDCMTVVLKFCYQLLTGERFYRCETSLLYPLAMFIGHLE